MDFDRIVEVFEELEKTASGNQIREILAEFFKTVPVEDIGLVAYLTLGKIGADFESNVLGLAEKTVLKAIAKAGAVSENSVKEKVRQKGDAGLAAQEILKKKPQTLVPVPKLTIHSLFDTLHKIVKLEGTGSQEKKINLLVSLFQGASSTGAKYVARITLGTLRMGVADMAVLDGLAIAFTGEKKNKEILERAYNICSDISIIATTLAQDGLKGIEIIDVEVGRPIKMMLAQRVSEWEEIQKKMPGKVACEGKYDGERVQAHKDKDGKITLFSRRLDNTTAQFPDLVEYLKNHVNAKEYIIEGEIIATDENGKLLPFQTLMQRRRKYNVEEYIKKIPIKIKLFDLLYLDGKSFVHEPYEKRTSTLRSIVKENKHVLMADQIITDDLNEVNVFFEKMLNDGDEGIMVKNLQGEYQAGTRGWNWIKWKKDYMDHVSDTFDLVVVGAYYGRGRRSGSYGALLCACYNAEKEVFETVCKLGTGLTDEMLEKLPLLLEKNKVEKCPKNVVVKKEMEPDVWFTPGMVVEVLAAEITKSPYHSLGLALRFPRFVRIREKDAHQATTREEIEEMFS